MTERLYYTDPYLTDFDARLQSVAEREGRTVLVLDRTAFYPTSGGQPFDTGTLAGIRVLEVVEAENGTIEHVLDGRFPPAPPALTVHGRIDWNRRFDHMQQHTGQHVLSAAFDRLHQARTMSFHMGREAATIDLAIDLPPAAIASAETEANRIVWEDRPVITSFVTPEQASSLAFRKEPVRAGTLRVVEVEGFDVSACGGTHVARTGAIGVILIAGTEKFRGGTRVTFVCGGRAMASYRTARQAIDGSVRLLSVLPSELPSAIERVQADMKEARRRIKELAGDLAVHEAAALIGRAGETGSVRIVVESIDGDATRLKDLAGALAGRPTTVAALVSRTSPHLLVVARSGDVALESDEIVREMTKRFGGRGGGRPEMAQAGGLGGPPDAIADAVREAIAARLSDR
jgi:alanyl-tRNA synthetase